MTNERHLTALSDAFCGAYAENDCVTLKLCIDFVKELSEDLTQQKDQMREKLMHIIKQLFCAADFSEGKYLWKKRSLPIKVAAKVLMHIADTSSRAYTSWFFGRFEDIKRKF